jgi:hypothetical protein
MAYFVVYDSASGSSSARPVLRWGECPEDMLAAQAINAGEVAVELTSAQMAALNGVSDVLFSTQAPNHYTINQTTLVIAAVTQADNTSYLAGVALERAKVLLDRSAWTQTVEAALSDARRALWRSYRQDLRDIASQPGFPTSITWPSTPDPTENDPNPLDVRLYRRTNILASVGLSSGVPNGGLFEAGANSNGRFLRTADGAQFCSRTMSAGFLNADVLLAGWTFPAAFLNSGSYALAVTMSRVDDDGNNTGMTLGRIARCTDIISARSATSISIQIRSDTETFASGDSVQLNLTASGRWA